MKLLPYTPYSLETHGTKESEMGLDSSAYVFRDVAHIDGIRINYQLDAIVIDIPHEQTWSVETNITVKPGREHWQRCYQLARSIRAAIMGRPVSLSIWHHCVQSAQHIHIPADGAWTISAQNQEPGGQHSVTVISN